jgi:capsular polysaccharide biosynthesis protein
MAQGPNQILDLLRALRRRRYQVLVPACLVWSIGIAFAVIVPKRYKVTTRIEISDRTRIETDYRLRNPQETAVRREATSAFEHVVHFARVKQVVEQNQADWPEYFALSSETERAQFLRERILTKNLSAQPTNRDPKNGTIFVDVSYSDENKLRAAEFLNDLVLSWLEWMKETDRVMLVNEGAMLREIMDAQQADLRDKEERYFNQLALLGQDPTAPSGDGRREERGDWTFRTLDKYKSEQSDIEQRLKTARFELEQAETRLRTEPPELARRVEIERDDPESELGRLREQRAALLEKLEGLRPNNSTYKRLRPKLDQLETEIAGLSQGEVEPEERWETEPNPRVAEYETAVREGQDLVATLEHQRDQLTVRVAELEQETKTRTENYKALEELRNERDEAGALLAETSRQWATSDKSLKMLESAPPSWRLAQPPVPSSATATPDPFLVSAFAVVAGLALGVATALGSEYLRSCYRSVGELAAVMTVPVLGAIDTIVTRRERRRVQFTRTVGALSTAVIVGTIAWVTWLWHASPERLPLELQDAIERLRSSLR